MTPHKIHEMPNFEKAERFKRKRDGRIFLAIPSPDHFEIIQPDIDCHVCGGTGAPCAGECKALGTVVDANGDNKKCKDCNGDAFTCEACDGTGALGHGGRIEGVKGDMILFDEETKQFSTCPIQDHLPSGRMDFCNPPRYIFADQFDRIVSEVKG